MSDFDKNEFEAARQIWLEKFRKEKATGKGIGGLYSSICKEPTKLFDASVENYLSQVGAAGVFLNQLAQKARHDPESAEKLRNIITSIMSGKKQTEEPGQKNEEEV